MALFGSNGSGKLRFLVAGEMESGNSVVTVYDDAEPGHFGAYTLDPTTGQEVGPESAGEIPSLKQMPRVALSITPIDERKQIIWKSGL